MKKYYEVQIDVPKEHEKNFVYWLITHMEDMVQLPCFYQADRLEVLDSEISDTSKRFLCRYYYETDEDLESYLKKYADRLRGDLPEKWIPLLKFKRRLGASKDL